MQEQLRLLHRSLGVTVIYVTHDQDEAMTLSDRIAVMRDGRIEQVGTPREVYEQPANTWVASFLGDANLIDCRVVRQSSDRTVLATRGEPHTRLLAPPDDSDGPAEGADARPDAPTADPDERVFLMVRPQRIDLISEADSPGGDGDTHNSLPATVEAAYFSGTELRYLIITDQGESLHAISSIEEDREEFGAGDRVIARWPVEFGRLLSS